MYMKQMLEIGKAANGYVIECRVPIKPEEKKNAKDMCCCYPGSCEKQFIAKDTLEVLAIMTKLMPMLDEDYASESEFDKAFESAALKMEPHEK